jgi:hypothetical protein
MRIEFSIKGEYNTESKEFRMVKQHFGKFANSIEYTGSLKGNGKAVWDSFQNEITLHNRDFFLFFNGTYDGGKGVMLLGLKDIDPSVSEKKSTYSFNTLSTTPTSPSLTMEGIADRFISNMPLFFYLNYYFFAGWMGCGKVKASIGQLPI